MANRDYDLFTIGAGSGGVRASRVSASLGARVAVAEVSDLGGTCVNLGCIPKKLLYYAAHYAEDFEDAKAYGWTVGARSFDWKTLIAAKDREIARLNGIYRGLLEGSGVEIITGRARLVDPHTVEIGGRKVTANYILIATGGWPRMLEIPGAELAITSNEVFHLEHQPERVLIVGGGYIGVEFAGILHGMGSHVTLVYRGKCLLRDFDADIGTVLGEEMTKKGIDVRYDCMVERIEKAGGALRATLNDGSVLEVDQVLCAIGRDPNTTELGLEDVGVECRWNGAIAVDEYNRSSVESVYAIGDVTDRLQLTPVAVHEGMCLAATLFGGKPTAPDYTDVPSAVFSQPPIGTVGLSEAMAREHHGEIDVYLTRFRPLRHTLTGRDETVFMKLIVERSTDRVLGCHMVGPEAGEIIQGFAVAIKGRATKAQFDATIGIHPTAAEELVTMRVPAKEPPAP